jgi:hypothetical protein
MKAGIESRFFKWSMIFLLAFTVFFTVVGVMRHSYYSYIIYHKSPMAYVQDVLLFICFITAAANTYLIYKKENKFNFVWFVVAFGFLYLAIDATFSLHQYMREAFLKPGGMSIDFLFWVEKGDYVLIFILLLGLLFVPFVLMELAKNRRAFLFFIIAVIFSVIAVVADSFDLHLFDDGFQKFLQYIEEFSEAAAQIFFINSFLCVTVEKLRIGASSQVATTTDGR